MQKARRHPRLSSGLRPLVGARFQVLFTPLFTVLFTFPSRYLSTIGLSGVFSLAGWCRRIQTGFLRSRPTQDNPTDPKPSGTGLSPSAVHFPRCFPSALNQFNGVLQPRMCRDTYGLGCSAFARHYLRNHSCFLFLRVLRCFSSPGSPPLRDTLRVQGGLPHSDTCGSARLCRSPQFFAACHVLLRL
jgi:hypothetical protein